MCYVHNQWYDISCATLYFFLDLDSQKWNYYLKKAVKSNISHYRPISILTFFSKMFEKIIITRLIQHLNYNQTLVEFGFRNKSSTDSTTCKLLNDILTSLNSKLIVGSIFCDLQKAFDCVNDDTLLLKLNFYGITGLVNKLSESYLKNWFQRVIIVNKPRQYFSKWEPVSDGVSQGSIFGPLLFWLNFERTLKPYQVQ